MPFTVTLCGSMQNIYIYEQNKSKYLPSSTKSLQRRVIRRIFANIAGRIRIGKIRIPKRSCRIKNHKKMDVSIYIFLIYNLILRYQYHDRRPILYSLCTSHGYFNVTCHILLADPLNFWWHYLSWKTTYNTPTLHTYYDTPRFHSQMWRHTQRAEHKRHGGGFSKIERSSFYFFSPSIWCIRHELVGQFFHDVI